MKTRILLCAVSTFSVVFITACAPVLKTQITSMPSQPPEEASRILVRGFPYNQHYEKGRSYTYGPDARVGYGITKVGATIIHSIGASLGFMQRTTTSEGFGDIGGVLVPTKSFIEENALARSVLTVSEKREIGVSTMPDTIYVEGKSGNEAVRLDTPWYWWTWNIIDYVTLMAFVGVPVHYEKSATVTVGIYSEQYERLGIYKGTARVGMSSYVIPAEKLTEATLIYAYRDALSRAANEWETVLSRRKNK
jgi:hypothetical protein